MTAALIGYSGTFMRYALAVTPKNYLLFGCHIVNFSAQTTQGYRYINYHYMGGKQAALEQRAKEGLSQAGSGLDKAASEAEAGLKKAAAKVESTAKDVATQAKAQVDKVTR
jgi:mitochondrial pyruvate carrier 1